MTLTTALSYSTPPRGLALFGFVSEGAAKPEARGMPMSSRSLLAMYQVSFDTTHTSDGVGQPHDMGQVGLFWLCIRSLLAMY